MKGHALVALRHGEVGGVVVAFARARVVQHVSVVEGDASGLLRSCRLLRSLGLLRRRRLLQRCGLLQQPPLGGHAACPGPHERLAVTRSRAIAAAQEWAAVQWREYRHCCQGCQEKQQHRGAALPC